MYLYGCLKKNLFIPLWMLLIVLTIWMSRYFVHFYILHNMALILVLSHIENAWICYGNRCTITEENSDSNVFLWKGDTSRTLESEQWNSRLSSFLVCNSDNLFFFKTRFKKKKGRFPSDQFLHGTAEVLPIQHAVKHRCPKSNTGLKQLLLWITLWKIKAGNRHHAPLPTLHSSHLKQKV